MIRRGVNSCTFARHGASNSKHKRSERALLSARINQFDGSVGNPRVSQAGRARKERCTWFAAKSAVIRCDLQSCSAHSLTAVVSCIRSVEWMALVRRPVFVGSALAASAAQSVVILPRLPSCRVRESPPGWLATDQPDTGPAGSRYLTSPPSSGRRSLPTKSLFEAATDGR